LLGQGSRAPCCPTASSFVSRPAMGKKFLEDLTAAFLQDKALPGDAMVLLQVKNVDDRTDGTCLRIGAP